MVNFNYLQEDHIISLFYKFFGLSSLFPKSKFFSKYNQTYIDENQIQEVDSVSGSCMMFKRKLLKNIGFFDESFFLYFEDTDFCLRAINAGYKVIYNPETQIIHYKNQSSIHAPFEVQDVFNQSLLQFYNKYQKLISYGIFINFIVNVSVYFRKIIFRLYSFRKEIFASLLDTLSIIFSFLLSIFYWYSFQYEESFHTINFSKHWPLIFTFVIMWLFAASLIKLYKKNAISYGASLFNSIISFLLTTTITYFLSFFAFSRVILLIASFLIGILTGTWRILIHYLHKYSKFNSSFIYHYLFARNAIILGADQTTIKIREKLLFKPNLNYNNIVFIDDKITEDFNQLIVGRLEDVYDVIKKYKINEVIIPESNTSIPSIIDFIQKNSIANNVEFKFLSSNKKYIIGKSHIEEVDDLNLIKLDYVLFDTLQKNIKRIFDVSLSLISIIIISPFLFYHFIINGMKKEFKWGINGKKIIIYKIKSNNDFLAELPLIYSILKGDLSFVGSLLVDYTKADPNLFIKPGITGLSKQKLNNNKLLIQAQDEYYIQNYSLIFDIEILLKSLLKL